MELTDIKGIGPKGLILLKKLNINKPADLISYYPFRYNILKRSDLSILENNDNITIDGIVENIPSVYYISKRLDKMSFRLNVGTNILNIVIYNRGFLKSYIKIGGKITVIGKYDKNKKLVTANDIRLSLLPNVPLIEPVYGITYGLSNKQLKSYIDRALTFDIDVASYLPDYLEKKYNFNSKKEDTFEIHNPTNLNKLNKAINHIKYEELFLFMLKMNYLKGIKDYKKGLKRDVSYKDIDCFINSLPFKLTVDQLKCIKEIYEDLISNKRMNRLLQGDVGSGKTIVALIAMYINYLSGYQCALMVPTEILANQHYNTAINILKDKNIHIELLTGKLKVSEKKAIYKKLENKEIDIIIGTHALIQDEVKYNNLGLVITDEQHRFGVNQRGFLNNKGMMADVLYMSATPIPRTYALTLYGDMDISSIKTMPKGRKDIITRVVKETDVGKALSKMYDELKQGHQIYVVAPLVYESDKIELENVYKLEEKFNKAFGKLYNIKVLHGKQEHKEKELIMNDFKDNKVQILISTTVIEVGVDVPNATMIVVFDSFRFGLSTLHQLRGRVGRGSEQSYCILMSNHQIERLKVLTETNDGFKISEEDFRLRGSGDLFGIRQSGDMQFRLADIKKDFSLLIKAKDDSLDFLNNSFDCKEYKGLKDLIVKSNNLS